MTFVPAVSPGASVTEAAWCFAFVEGQLLLPDDSASSLTPQPWVLFQALAASRHYLGRLDGIDCWAVALAEPRPAGAGCRHRLPGDVGLALPRRGGGADRALPPHR